MLLKTSLQSRRGHRLVGADKSQTQSSAGAAHGELIAGVEG
jgi:hypothetical protein